MNRTFLVILAFLGVFICGALAGGALAMRYGRDFVQKRAAIEFNGQHLRAFVDRLQLTEEQKKKIRPLIARVVQDRLAMQKDFQAEYDRLIRDIEALLTPEQRQRLREFRDTERKRDRPGLRWLREQREQRAPRERAEPPAANPAPSP